MSDYQREYLKKLARAKEVYRPLKKKWDELYDDMPVALVTEVRVIYKDMLKSTFPFIKEHANFYGLVIRYEVLSDSGKTKNVNFITITDSGYILRQDPYYKTVRTKSILQNLQTEVDEISDLMNGVIWHGVTFSAHANGEETV